MTVATGSAHCRQHDLHLVHYWWQFYCSRWCVRRGSIVASQCGSHDPLRHTHNNVTSDGAFTGLPTASAAQIPQALCTIQLLLLVEEVCQQWQTTCGAGSVRWTTSKEATLDNHVCNAPVSSSWHDDNGVFADQVLVSKLAWVRARYNGVVLTALRSPLRTERMNGCTANLIYSFDWLS